MERRRVKDGWEEGGKRGAGKKMEGGERGKNEEIVTRL
jgi:hypothetical protein